MCPNVNQMKNFSTTNLSFYFASYAVKTFIKHHPLTNYNVRLIRIRANIIFQDTLMNETAFLRANKFSVQVNLPA